MIDVLIIHYNTPELTAATINSLWKHTPNARVTVFDNSDDRPFSPIGLDRLNKLNRENGLFTLVDNTRGQIVDWDQWLTQFPNKMPCPENNWGSAKHCYSVEIMMDIFPDGFVLMDSDVLIRRDIREITDPSVAWSGGVHVNTKRYGVSIPRITPFICWINTPILRQHDIRYFNPDKMWKLHTASPQCWYDTGAWLLEACNNAGVAGKRIRLEDYAEHYGGGSWRKHTPESWLGKFRSLWEPVKPLRKADGTEVKYTVLSYIFNNYEQVHEVEEKDPEADYVLVTDNPLLHSDTWRVVVDEMPGFDAIEKMYAVRYHPFRYVGTEFVVRLDGAIGINKPLLPIIEEMERGGYDRMLMIHPRRNTLPDEYCVWVRKRNYPQASAAHILSKMQQAGYDLHYRGLFQSCFEVVRNNEVNHDVNSMTFQLLHDFTPDGHIDRIDQTLLSYVVNHHFAERLKVLPVSESIVTDGNLMTWYKHNSFLPNHSRQTTAPMMFNRPCVTWAHDVPRYTVLTYIFGDYERVHEIEEKDPNADYILVTDNPSLHSDTWRIVLDELSGLSAMEKCYDVRYHPFRYAKTELCVRLDSSIGINGSLRPFIEKMQDGQYDRCLMVHPSHLTMQEEYDAWVGFRRYSQEYADHALATLKRLGYDMQYQGLFQACFEVVRDNKVNSEINEQTFQLLHGFAPDGEIERIDQTLLSYVVNRYFAERLKVLPVPESVVGSDLMTWYWHNSDKAKRLRKPIDPIMFNKPCEAWMP